MGLAVLRPALTSQSVRRQLSDLFAQCRNFHTQGVDALAAREVSVRIGRILLDEERGNRPGHVPENRKRVDRKDQGQCAPFGRVCNERRTAPGSPLAINAGRSPQSRFAGACWIPEW